MPGPEPAAETDRRVFMGSGAEHKSPPREAFSSALDLADALGFACARSRRRCPRFRADAHMALRKLNIGRPPYSGDGDPRLRRLWTISASCS